MFTWMHEDSMEVDLPLQKAWNFFTDPSNWPKWENQFETCVLEGTLRAGAQIKAKIKNKPIRVVILVTEVRPYCECKYLLRLFSFQESLFAFKSISPEKTRVTLKLYVFSLFTPFMKGTFITNMEKNRLNRLNLFAETTAEV
jgi:polyketide cyclase/dehydrase/lipid transport protein